MVSKSSPDLSSEMYQALPPEKWKTWGLWSGGIAAILLGAIGFTFALFVDVDQLQLHFISTFPILIGISLLSSGFVTGRKRNRIEVGQEELSIYSGPSRPPRKISWDEIAFAKRNQNPYSASEVLILHGYDGKKITSIDSHYHRVSQLFESIEEKVASHAKPDAGQAATKHDRKSAIFVICVGSGFLLLSIFIGWMTYDDARQRSLLETEATLGVAQVEDLVVAPNGTTKRLHYRVDIGDGKTYESENIQVTDEYWDSIQDATTVPVVYASSDPNISRLEEGQVFDDDVLKTPLGGYGLSAIGCLMSLGFIILGTLQMLGFDLGQFKV